MDEHQNEKEKIVITPGGPRSTKQTQLVREGEAVSMNEKNEPIIIQKPTTMSEEMVLTPGGFRHRSLVHKIESGHALHIEAGRVRLKNLSSGIVSEFADAALGKPVVPALGSGWIAYGYWNNGTGKSITSFSSSWIVPPPPSVQSSQVIFLFNGIQNYGANYGILQPVLQWGVSAAGGGAYWSIASWYVTSGGQAFFTNLVNVNPGDNLIGVMKLTGSSASGFNYTSEFQGVPSTILPVQNIAELFWCNETLEAYSIDTCSNYPNTDFTAFRNINIQTGTESPVISWTPVNRITDCGQHAVIVDNSSQNGEVDIYYRIPKRFKTIYLAWAWLILVGYILITPIGPICITCGNPLSELGSRILGFVTIAVGILGLARSTRRSA
ncbi:MAG: hypothetical protein JST75_07650 [Bacteroidetes bacterium]|nr:hypothetical protein [Bacteroidota bacterium]